MLLSGDGWAGLTSLATHIVDGVGEEDPGTGLDGLEGHHHGLAGPVAGLAGLDWDHLVSQTGRTWLENNRLGRQSRRGRAGLDVPVQTQVDGGVQDGLHPGPDGRHLLHLLLLLVVLAAGVAVLLVRHGDVRQEVEVVQGRRAGGWR